VALFGTVAALATPAEIWVATDGANANPGTREKPLATLDAALRCGRELRRLKDPSVADGIRLMLRDGTYALSEPVLIRPEDSGTEAGPTVIAAAPGERPVLSGGIAIRGWRKVSDSIPGLPAAAQDHVWVADAPIFDGRILEFRQLWVNGRKAVRARTPDDGTMTRLVGWVPAKEEAWVPASAVAALRNLYGVEMVILQQWEIAVLRLKAVRIEGDRACVTFHQPESRIEFEHPWPQPVMQPTGNSPFFLAGAVEFLDHAGEWCQELPGGRILYWPRDGEDPGRDAIVAPALETLVQVTGSLDRPVAYVQFKGIEFAYTTWLRPSQLGHVPHQAAMFMVDAYKLRPKGTPDWRSLDNQAWIGRAPAAVAVAGAHHTRFERCRFEHTAMSGLDYVSGTHDDTIEGCTFRDIGANGLQMGNFGDPGIEIHLPYEPADARVVCTRERIANNFVTDTANEDWGGVALAVGWAPEVTIEHNDIFRTSYTGISLGWGWTRTPNVMRKNVVRANRIRQFATRMSDTAGVYLLSAQPGTVVSENCVDDVTISPYVHDPEHWFYLYLDEGSSFTTVRDNWCPAERFLANANGPGNVWERNGPGVPASIKEAAGLEPAFRDLLSADGNVAGK
jgi:hypothetical protein